MKNKKTIWFLGVILLLAIFLRTFNLNRVPPSLFGDEVDVGYQAYSILKTGKDYLGQSFPTYIHSLAEWRAPLLMYFTVPSIAIFGLNEWGVRIPPAIFGVLNVLFCYLLIKELFKNGRWALLGAFLIAINPWNIHYSRAAFEVTLLLFLILAGSWCFLRGISKPWYLLGTAILFGLTFYTYNTANVFIPLLIIILIVIWRKEILRLKNKPAFWFSLVIFLLFLIPISKELILGQAKERFGLISVFSDQKIIQEIHLRRLGGVSFSQPSSKISFWERIFTNRPVYWFLAISQNYLAAFSPDFLFARGDPFFRHSVGKVGEFYLIEVIFVILGSIVLINYKGKEKWFVFLWLLIAPIPSSLTKDGGNHATRLFLMIPPIVVLSSAGAVQLIKLGKNKKGRLFWLLGMLLIVSSLFFNFAFYLNRYFVWYPKESWKYWGYGFKEAMVFIGKHQGEFEEVLISNSQDPALIRYLFWTNYDPVKFQQSFTGDKPSENILPGFDGFKLGNAFFVKPRQSGWWEKVLTPKVLYLASQDDIGGDWDWRKNPPQGVKVLETITNPYSQPIFWLVTHE